MKKYIKRFAGRLSAVQSDGIGVIEIILILVILIGLVLIFKDNITAIVTSAFKSITSDSSTIIN